ncbi:helicase-exonuclease AddAB subunit AddA [Clostridium senegalense]|uniref:helicase-exonuclease AddAB subunit AddA n=1 Tax=Clostridium senegalense TaxID=1465809 RepID=UPI0002894166|nr:helicase-exonuclease AddAB subunit AddA [Clostridium senegalense]
MSDNKVKFTKEQQWAIDTRNANLLVAAAAGSGKTAVLVQRIINMITDKDNLIDIDKLLVVTFTNAAASEMRERIGDAISKEIASRPTSKHLQRQLTLLNKASIMTIHSFCLEVIKRNFHMIDLDPSFRVADETETELLKQESLEEVFEKMYEDNDEIFLELIECYCNNKNDLNLFNMVLDLYRFSMSTPYPKQWLQEKSEMFNIGEEFKIEDSSIGKALINDIGIELESLTKSMKIAKNIVEEDEYLEKYYKVISNEYSYFRELYKNRHSLESLKNIINNIKFVRMPSIKNCENKVSQEEVKNIRETNKKKILELTTIINKATSNYCREDIKYLYPLMKKLCELVINLSKTYQAKKKEKGIIDFNDFEHFALEILTNIDEESNIKPSKIAMELREKYDEILIDEYQDSNYVQEYILTMISKGDIGENNIFMVGDVKQSIYRFRMAKPELFLEKKNTYSELEGAKERLVKLYKNFRSREEVINAVNYIFKNIMSEQLGELDYTEEESLNLGADYEELEDGVCGGPVEVMLFENENILEENGDVEEEEISTIELEARAVGQKIKEFIEGKNNFKVFDKNLKEYRIPQYKDIVVLLRATSSYAPIFSEELKKIGIPVYTDANDGYFNTLEIKTMISLLEIIDNPKQDIPLLAVLRSPIGGFSSEDIVNVRLNSPETDIYDALKNYIELEHTELTKKISGFLDKLDIWRKKSLIVPIDELIWNLYMETGYYGYVGAMPTGEKRQANLRMLFQRAKQYDKTSYKGLFNFIKFIDKVKSTSGDLGSAKTIGENENVVRIMSIHKSKGLEFPVVFLSAMGKQFNTMDIKKKILFHHELGFGPEVIDFKRRISYSPIIKDIIKNKIKKENLSEEMRILYVAFTRAKEKLIISGSVKSFEKSIERWRSIAKNSEGKILQGYLIRANNYLDWIMPCIIRHEDGVFLLKNNKIPTIKDNSKWNVKLISYKDLIEYEDKIVNNKDIEEILNRIYEIHDDTIQNKVLNRLDYKYKYEKSTTMETNFTVSELKRQNNQEEEMEYTGNYVPSIVKRPKFLEEKKILTPAEKGTAVHAVMQRLDFSQDCSEAGIRRQIKQMVENELITEEQEKVIKISKIINFLNDDLGKKIIEAYKEGTLNREVPFSIEVRAKEVYKELEEDVYDNEFIKIQGIIDGYFEKNNKIILFDYKTDYISMNNENGIQSIKEKYKMQLDYYSRALEKGIGKPVIKKYLYLFSIDKSEEVK